MITTFVLPLTQWLHEHREWQIGQKIQYEENTYLDHCVGRWHAEGSIGVTVTIQTSCAYYMVRKEKCACDSYGTFKDIGVVLLSLRFNNPACLAIHYSDTVLSPEEWITSIDPIASVTSRLRED